MKSQKPLIYLISGGQITNQNYSEESSKLLELIEVAVNYNVSMIQLREKKITTQLLYKLTSAAVKIRKNSESKIFVNDRADVALSAKADGVHLTENSISAKIIRENFPQDFQIGVSTHSKIDVLKAKNEGADFCVFGPVFETPNKGNPKGIIELNEVVNSVKDFPVLALGGIDEENYADVLNVGASGIAAIRFLNDAEKLPEIMKRIEDKFYE